MKELLNIIKSQYNDPKNPDDLQIAIDEFYNQIVTYPDIDLLFEFLRENGPMEIPTDIRLCIDERLYNLGFRNKEFLISYSFDVEFYCDPPASQILAKKLKDEAAQL